MEKYSLNKIRNMKHPNIKTYTPKEMTIMDEPCDK
jgi:hypothetical protein